MRNSLALMAGLAALFCGSTAFAQDGLMPISEPAEGNSAEQRVPRVAVSQDAEKKLQAQIDALQNELNTLKADAQKQKAALGNTADGEKSTTDKVMDYISDRFRFGSYGRVQPGMNPDGMKMGRQTRLVSPTPRVDEGSYVELSMAYTPYRNEDGTVVDIVTTLAFDGDKLFHNDGQWDAGIAVRNLYAEARNLWFDGFVLWAGSRMYRGDDIYLLDTWPLDNLNTYGGGLGWHGHTGTNIDLHFGTNRLKNDYQYQVVDVINERFVGEQEVIFLNRQRFISSLKVEQLWGGNDGPQFKAKLYGEVHAIGEGEFLQTQPELIKKLPSDNGWLIGAQFGVSNFLDDSYVNIFVKYAAGLAAYGEMAVPFGIDTEMKAADAKHFMAGVSAGLNFFDYADLLLGGYVRYFEDADGISQDFDDGVEGVWDVRITGHIGKYFRPGIEFSQQLRKPNGLSPVNQKQDLASIFKFSLLPAVRFGDGILGRPEIRFNYTVSVLNEAARNIFPERDELRSAEVVHFIGIAAEWWFNL